MYSKSLETYQNIVDNQTISNEQKSIAIKEIDKINNLQNSINVAEELIKLKGFEDVVIYSSNEKISVIVRSAALSPTQVAQIQNIVSKEFSVNISDITISNKWKKKEICWKKEYNYQLCSFLSVKTKKRVWFLNL